MLERRIQKILYVRAEDQKLRLLKRALSRFNQYKAITDTEGALTTFIEQELEGIGGLSIAMTAGFLDLLKRTGEQSSNQA